MKIKKLNVTNFRIYDQASVELNSNTNIFFGNNAQGKTSIIESINVLGLTKSHKTNKDRDMIKNNEEYAKINALIHLNDKDIQLDIILSKLGKKAKYNQIELERLSDYIGILNVVMFAPEDLDLIKGNPQVRRKFLDLEIGQISKEYLYNVQNYKRILKQRNDLLKNMQQKSQDLMLLDIVTEQLIDYMEKIVAKRKMFLNQINEIAQKIYKDLSNVEQVFKIEYIPSVDKNYKEEFQKKQQYDIITGTTNVGIHRDDIEFYIDDHFIKTHSSQGELRSAVLSTKLALVEFIYKRKGEYPVLLLDDVLSELDINRQNNLIQYINNKTQTFITTTDLSEINFKTINNFSIFHIENGTIKESEQFG